MKIKEEQQKIILGILAAICLVLAVVCVWMIACPGNDAEDPVDEEFVYNPGETGLDENGDTIIIVQDTDTDELDSIPNGIENEGTTSDSDTDENGEDADS